VSAADLPGLQGAIVWAISPFENEAPFKLLRYDGSTRRYDQAGQLARAVLKEEEPPEFDLVLAAKVRPVLLLQDRPVGRYPEYGALKMTRVERYPTDIQDAIRHGREETLLHLGHDQARYGLDKDCAIDLNALVRVHRTAIASKALGRVDASEFRTICERLIKLYDLDIGNLIVREASGLIQRLST
jgi:hypothetical protein